MDALDEGQKTGVASQFILESVEGTETFFGLRHKVGVALKGTETHRVVDMGDGDVVGTQLLAKEYVLIAIVTETLIERVGEHDFTTDEEVGRVEVAIGIPLSPLHGVLMFGCLLIAITEIVLEGFGITTDRDTAVDDIDIFQRDIFANEVWTHYCHVAVDKEQPLVFGLLCQEVANGGTPHILRLYLPRKAKLRLTLEMLNRQSHIFLIQIPGLLILMMKPIRLNLEILFTLLLSDMVRITERLLRKTTSMSLIT